MCDIGEAVLLPLDSTALLPGCAAEYINNLRFFVKHGMYPGDGCDYIIAVQQARRDNDTVAAETIVAALPGLDVCEDRAVEGG